MKAINNFDKIQESGSFEKLPVGGYIIKILAVDDVPEKEYLKIFFDINDGEKKGFFQKAFKEDTRAEKKWPNAGSFIRSYKEKALPMFKGFTNAIENSNKGYKWNFDEKSLVNKIVGVVIGEETSNSQCLKSSEQWECSIGEKTYLRNAKVFPDTEDDVASAL